MENQDPRFERQLEIEQNKKHRKEVHLTHEVIVQLQRKAMAEFRSLKNYMEQVLIAASEGKE